MWDLFISHASEDKDSMARPLYLALDRRGYSVWFDEATLTVGDSLREKVDEGLSNCRFGIVIISPHFLSKSWPKRELDALVAREDQGRKIILPVWHNITASEISERSPLLAAKLAAQSSDGIESVVNEIERAIGKPISSEKDVRRNVISPWADQPKLEHWIDASSITTNNRNSLPQVPVIIPKKIAGNILFDESHGQWTWDRSSIPVAEYGFYRICVEAARQNYSSWRLCRSGFNIDDLRQFQVLILVTPRDHLLTTREIQNVLTFVHSGGGLLILGYYCGDGHHGTNLNSLLKNFGIQFMENRIVDDQQNFGDCLQPLCSAAPSIYNLNLKQIVMPYTCSIIFSPDFSPVAENLLLSSSFSYSEQAKIVHAGIIRNFFKSKDGPFVVGVWSTYGRGRIAVFGTWEMFTEETINYRESSNLSIFSLIISWLINNTARISPNWF